MAEGKPTFREPDESARAWIEKAVNGMRAYFVETAQLRDDDAVTPAMLDEAWVEFRSAWRSAGSDDRVIRGAINDVGLAFGQVLVDRLGMEWVIATDAERTEFAVRGDSGWVVYPRDVVMKRHANDESGFLTALFKVIQERT
jgi:hypothetical protein